MTDVLRKPPGDYVGGEFLPIAGDAVISTNPADPSRVVWSGSPVPEHVRSAVDAARVAAPAWAAATLEQRAAVLIRFRDLARANADRIAELITEEMGKTIAESRFEAGAVAGKVDITIGGLERVTDYDVEPAGTKLGRCRFKPHGVMAVVGPFNFPAHLPNGHIVPALLLGNTVVLKPSEKTPAVGQLLAELIDEAGAPPGVFNLVQGDGRIAASLVADDGIDGILFTGSWPVGRRILEANIDRPGRIVALEMGGNNATVVLDDAHLRQAVIESARAAFATTGQRCTCTRRILVQRGIADRFIGAFGRVASMLVIGPGSDPEPVFMGPLVSAEAVTAMLDRQRDLAARGGRVLAEATALDRPGHFVSPGIVEVDRFDGADDCEVFGPLVQIAIFDDLDDAIEQVNATEYGLAASIFTNDGAAFERFFARVRCGCINHNTGTAGASSKLPFGGLGRSGNHRPAAAFSVDYCAYPVANMVETGDDVAIPAGMAWE